MLAHVQAGASYTTTASRKERMVSMKMMTKSCPRVHLARIWHLKMRSQAMRKRARWKTMIRSQAKANQTMKKINPR
jgi:hypothetical protein